MCQLADCFAELFETVEVCDATGDAMGTAAGYITFDI